MDRDNGTSDFFKFDKQERGFIKHDILMWYLQGFLPIMAQQKWIQKICIVDGFAGPGKHDNGDDGSPITICKTLLTHSTFTRKPELLKKIHLVFIEADSERAEELEQNLNEYRNRLSIEVVCGKFAEKILPILDDNDADANFVFVDPFGYTGVPMKTLRNIVSRPRTDILVTFMDGPIRRFRNDPNKQNAINIALDTTVWQNIAKECPSDETLRQIADIFQNQLKLAIPSDDMYTVKFAMKGKNNSHLYHLVFASKHLAGIKAMKYAMGVNSKSRSKFIYSEFDGDKTKTILEDILGDAIKVLQEKFKDKPVFGEDIEHFIWIKTDYYFNFKIKLRKKIEEELQLVKSERSFNKCEFLLTEREIQEDKRLKPKMRGVKKVKTKIQDKMKMKTKVQTFKKMKTKLQNVKKSMTIFQEVKTEKKTQAKMTDFFRSKRDTEKTSKILIQEREG